MTSFSFGLSYFISYQPAPEAQLDPRDNVLVPLEYFFKDTAAPIFRTTAEKVLKPMNQMVVNEKHKHHASLTISRVELNRNLEFLSDEEKGADSSKGI